MELNEKTGVLIEALPYIKKYSGRTIVIKFGGNTLSEMEHVVEDIVLLKHIGINLVVVHGGGPEIDERLKKKGITPRFINGLRHTDENTMKIAEKVFDSINREIVKNLISHGAKAKNIKNSIYAVQKSSGLGLVGEIKKIDKGKISRALKRGVIPVISPIGIGEVKKKYNINADTAASHVAVTLGAEKLTLLTNVDGVIIGGKLLSHLDFGEAIQEIKHGSINKGMIPKVEACIYAVENKCLKAHLINGLVPHSLLLEIFTDKGVGTEIACKNEYKKNN